MKFYHLVVFQNFLSFCVSTAFEFHSFGTRERGVGNEAVEERIRKTFTFLQKKGTFTEQRQKLNGLLWECL